MTWFDGIILGVVLAIVGLLTWRLFANRKNASACTSCGTSKSCAVKANDKRNGLLASYKDTYRDHDGK